MKIGNDTIELDNVQLTLFKKVEFAISITIFSIAFAVLIGWYFDIDLLKSINLNWASMKIQTAISFLFSSVSLWLLSTKIETVVKKRIFYFSSWCVFLGGFFVIVEYATGINLHIDFAGRMSIITAVNFFLYGIAFLTLFNKPRLSQKLTFIPLIISYVITLNYLFSEVQYVQSLLFSVAAHTAFCFVILGIGLLLSQIEFSFLRYMVANTTGSIVRQLFFATLIFVPFISWLRLEAQKLGLFNLEFGVSLFTVAIILSFGALIFWTAKKIDKTEEMLRMLFEKEHTYRVEQSQFMTMLAHELKNPLATIHLALGFISESEDVLRFANKAIQDIQALIQRCLESEKLNDQKIIICLDTHNLFDKFQKIIQSTYSASRLVINVEPSWSIETDGQLLYSILFNLIENALKYSPPDSLINVDVQKEKAHFSITVKNKIGIAGVPEESNVFKKYYRNKAAHHEIGSGLGLYLVKTMTHLLGGEIIYSHDNNCVCFNLLLPFSINQSINP